MIKCISEIEQENLDLAFWLKGKPQISLQRLRKKIHFINHELQFCVLQSFQMKVYYKTLTEYIKYSRREIYRSRVSEKKRLWPPTNHARGSQRLRIFFNCSRDSKYLSGEKLAQ